LIINDRGGFGLLIESSQVLQAALKLRSPPNRKRRDPSGLGKLSFFNVTLWHSASVASSGAGVATDVRH